MSATRQQATALILATALMLVTPAETIGGIAMPRTLGELAALNVPQKSPQSSRLRPAAMEEYDEDFSTVRHRHLSTTANWDTLEGNLTLALKDAVAQTDPAVTVDASGNTFVVWKAGTALYARKFDSQGTLVWIANVQVHVAGVATSGPGVAVDDRGDLLVVWHDERNGDWDVYAQKLSSRGIRLWPADKLISIGNVTAPYYPVETPPAITSDGNEFFVIWHDYRGAGWDIYAQRLDKDGNRLWLNDTRVNWSHLGNNRWPHAHAQNGLVTVIWTESEMGILYAQQLDAVGTPRWDGEKIVPGQHQASVDNRVVTFSDGSAVMAWSYRDAVYMQRLSPSGTRLWANDVQITASGSRTPGLAGLTGGSSVVAWRGPDGRVHSQRLSASGAVQWPMPALVSSRDTSVYWYALGMATDPLGNVSITWIDDRTKDQDVYLQRLSSDGRLLWPREQRVNLPYGVTKQTGPSVLAGEDHHLVAWVDSRYGGDVYVQKLGGNGSPLWTKEVRANGTRGTVKAAGTALARAADGSSYVLWVSTELGREDLFLQRFDSRGNRMWNLDTQVNTTPGSWVLFPRLAVSPTGDLIVSWWDSRAVKMQRLSANGNRQWDFDLYVRGISSDYDMDVDGVGAGIITWWEYRDGGWPEPPSIFAQRIDAAGQFLWGPDGTRVNRDTGGWYLYPSVAVDRSRDAIWIAWSDAHRTDGDIMLQRLTLNGEPLWSTDQVVNYDPSSRRQEYPSIGIETTSNAIVTWTDYRNDPFDYRHTDIYAQRITPDGARLWVSDVLINQADGSPSDFSVSPFTDGILVAWADFRNGNTDVFTQRLTSSGQRAWGADVNVVRDDRFYIPAGSAESTQLTGPGIATVAQAALTGDFELNGGDVRFFLTNNGGSDWFPITPGVTHVFTTTGSDLRWRVDLTADPLWPRTPIINSLRIEYSTALPYADDYEPDDACPAARPIAVSGAAQAHTFHQQADADWAWFDATAGTTYVIETRNTGTRATTVIEPHATCTAPPTSGGRAFGPGYTISFTAPTTGRTYLKVFNHDPNAFGADTDYTLSVRAVQPSAVAIIVAGHDGAFSAQENITYASDRAYRIFRNAGIPKANIRYLAPLASYDADGDGSNDVAGPPTVANIRDAVQDWARSQGVRLGVPFYLYLVDHGLVDRFKANGDAADRHITATELNLWLSNLEATSGTDNINVIIDACYSGSFIDETAAGPATISGRNRVVLASTTSDWLAFGPAGGQGLYFSNAFFSALENEQSLYASYLVARQAVEAQDLLQRPWLDDNGDRRSDTADGALASDRALRRVALGGLSPRIQWVRGDVRTGQVWARVHDDSAWVNVRVEVYAPSYVPPGPDGSGTTRIVDVPVVVLRDPDGDGVYTDTFNFSEDGAYRLVAHAQDTEGNLALPVTGMAGAGAQVYLPLIVRGR